jgi:hypothetical protein
MVYFPEWRDGGSSDIGIDLEIAIMTIKVSDTLCRSGIAG